MPLKGRRAEVQKMTTGRGNSPRPVPMLKNTTKKRHAKLPHLVIFYLGFMPFILLLRTG